MKGVQGKNEDQSVYVTDEADNIAVAMLWVGDLCTRIRLVWLTEFTVASFLYHNCTV